MEESVRFREVSFMNKGSWLRFVIAGALLALMIPASASAYPTVDDGFGKVTVKERSPGSQACDVNPRLWKIDPNICRDERPEPSSFQGEPASNPVPATGSQSALGAEWLLVALAVVLAGTAGTIVGLKRRPRALG
jgi:hypothetical protein